MSEWSNHQTETLALAISNDEPLYKHFRMLTQTARATRHESEDNGRGWLAVALESYWEDKCNLVMPSRKDSGYRFGVASLLSSAIAAVDWDELAEFLLDVHSD